MKPKTCEAEVQECLPALGIARDKKSVSLHNLTDAPATMRRRKMASGMVFDLSVSQASSLLHRECIRATEIDAHRGLDVSVNHRTVSQFL